MTTTSRMLALSVFCAAVMAAAPFAHAEGPGDKGRLAADTNGDNKVTASERESFAKGRFAAMDVDKDGQITDADIDARLKDVKAKNPKVTDAMLQKRNAGIKAHFASMDKDGSKGVSMDEFLARGKDLTTAADTNKDGAISAEEMKAFRDAKRANKGKDAPAGQ
ncbi:MAG: hypothetical protein V4621_02990 [Pseudomonadota bacterium]